LNLFEYDKAGTTIHGMPTKEMNRIVLWDKNGLPKIMERENQVTLSESYEGIIGKKTRS
jgi:hypothetical protein